MIVGQNYFYQPIKSDQITCDNIRKISPDQEDNFTTDCLLNYFYFIENCKLIAIDLSKQKNA